MKKIKNLLFLLKIPDQTVIITPLLLAALDYSPIDVRKVILVSLPFLLVYYSGQILNDVADQSGDKINHPERPLVNGSLSLSFAKVLSLIFLLLSVIVAYLQGILLIVLIGIVFGVFYSLKPFRFKGRPFFDLFTMGVCLTILPYFAIYQLQNKMSFQALPMFFIFLFGISANLVAMIADYRGDYETGAMTTAVYLGVKKSVYLGLSFLFAAHITGLVMVHNHRNPWYYLFLPFLVWDAAVLGYARYAGENAVLVNKTLTKARKIGTVLSYVLVFILFIWFLKLSPAV